MVTMSESQSVTFFNIIHVVIIMLLLRHYKPTFETIGHFGPVLYLHPAVTGHEVTTLTESEAVSLVFTKVASLCTCYKK